MSIVKRNNMNNKLTTLIKEQREGIVKVCMSQGRASEWKEEAEEMNSNTTALLEEVIKMMEEEKKVAFDFPNSVLEPEYVDAYNEALSDIKQSLQEAIDNIK